MRYLIRHESRVSFADSPVREHHCELRIAPRADVLQTVHRLTLRVEPEATLCWWRDCFGNQVANFTLLPTHEYYATHLSAEVETRLAQDADREAVAPGRERRWITEALRAQPRLLGFMLHRSAATPDLLALAKDLGLALPAVPPDQPVTEAVQLALTWISEHFTYHDALGSKVRPLHVLLKEGAGDSHDFAHLLIALLRSWDIPARYVTGYRARDVEQSLENQGLPATAYAWADVLIPGIGWQGFDAVHGQTIDERYVTVAIGRDHIDAEPRREVYKGAEAREGSPETVIQMTPQQ